MFLGNLLIKEQYYFLELADKLIHSDGDIKVAEQALFSSYLKEMGLTKDYEIQGIDTDTMINSIDNAQSQKIFYLELLALCAIDSDFNTNEKLFMQYIADGFSLPQEFIIDCERWIVEMSNLYRRGHILVFS